MGKKKIDGKPRLREMIIDAVTGLMAKHAPAHQIADEILSVVSINAARETKRRSCAACGHEFKSFDDFPRVHFISFKKNDVPEKFSVFTHDVTKIVKNILEMKSIKSCVASIEGKEHEIIYPANLLPPWPEDGYFKKAFVVPETCGSGEDTGYIMLKDVETSSTLKELGVDARAVDIVLAINGPNIGSAGGPAMALVHAIGRVMYEGMLNISSTARDDEKGLRKELDELLAEDDEPLKCPGCGNAKTFRLATWNCYFDVGIDGKVEKIHGGYYAKDIADMDDVIIICPECDKVVLDTTW